MKVAIALFDRVTALDAIGPYEILQRVPDFEITFVGHRPGEVRTENGMLGLTVDATFEEMPTPEVVLVPGGIGSPGAARRRARAGVGPRRPRHPAC